MRSGQVAVIGCGYWGQNLVRTFHALLGPDRVVACDMDPSRLALMRERHPGVRTADDPGPLWKDPAVVAAAIATPAVTHYPVALRALEAGKHVFVEKPLTIDPGEASALAALAGRLGLVLMVDHLYLHHPAFEALARLVRAGAIGEVRYVMSRRLNLGIVRTEENALWSLGPHDVAMALALMAEAPVRVSAHGDAFLQHTPPVHDVVHVALAFPSGRAAYLHLSWLDPHKVREVTVVGTNGMAVFDDVASEHRLQVLDRGAEVKGGRPHVWQGQATDIPVSGEEPLTNICRRFLERVEGTAPHGAGEGRMGADVVRVLASAQQSLAAGGQPVEIAEVATHG